MEIHCSIINTPGADVEYHDGLRILFTLYTVHTLNIEWCFLVNEEPFLFVWLIAVFLVFFGK